MATKKKDTEKKPEVYYNYANMKDEEVDAELAKIAEAYKMQLEQVKSFIPAVEIKKDLAINKAIDFIKANAEITAE